MKKGQSAMEFVVLATMMFLFFAITIIYVQNLLVDFTEQSQDATVSSIEDAIVGELARAERMPNGYYRTFTLPESIQGVPYSAYIENETPPRRDALVVTVNEKTHIRFLDGDTFGYFSPGPNTLQKSATGVITVGQPGQALVTGVDFGVPDWVYTQGQPISLRVTFSRPVFVTGSPRVALNAGGNAVYSGGSGSPTLTFLYTPAANQRSSDLDYTSASITLAGDTIDDGLGRAASTSLLPVGTLAAARNVRVDLLFTNNQAQQNVVNPSNALSYALDYAELGVYSGGGSMPCPSASGGQFNSVSGAPRLCNHTSGTVFTGWQVVNWGGGTTNTATGIDIIAADQDVSCTTCAVSGVVHVFTTSSAYGGGASWTYQGNCTIPDNAYNYSCFVPFASTNVRNTLIARGGADTANPDLLVQWIGLQ